MANGPSEVALSWKTDVLQQATSSGAVLRLALKMFTVQ